MYSICTINHPKMYRIRTEMKESTNILVELAILPNFLITNILVELAILYNFLITYNRTFNGILQY